MAESKVIPKKRKGRKKKVIAVSLVGVLAAGGIGGALYYKQNSAVKMPEDTRQAQSATAELGSITLCPSSKKAVKMPHILFKNFITISFKKIYG